MCYQAFCGTKKGGSDYYITKARVANISSMKNIFEQLQCGVCRNLLRQPKQCANSKCESNICQKCISDSLALNGGKCPCCKIDKPQFVEINRFLKNLIVKAQVKCISCKKAVPWDQLDDHELHCGKCNLCNAAKLSPVLSIH